MPSRSIEQAALAATAVSPFLFFYFMVEGGFSSWQDYSNLIQMKPGEWSRFVTMLETGSALFTLSTLVFINAFLANFARLVEMTIFRQLRDQELKYTLEESLNFLLLKLIVIWASSDLKPDIGLWPWLSWFMVTGWSLALTTMCKARLEFAMSSPSTMGWQQSRVVGLLLAIMALNVASTLYSVSFHLGMSTDFILLWVFDGIANTCIGIKSLTTFFIHQTDLSRGLTEAEKVLFARALFYLDMGTTCLFFLHYVHILWIHGLSFMLLDLVLFLKARSSMEHMRRLLRNHQRFMRLNAQLADVFQPATPAELAAASEPCAICRDDLNDGGCKLVCGHMFHQSCIRQWASRQPTCPTCRTPLLDPNTDANGHPHPAPHGMHPPLTAATAALNGQPERAPRGPSLLDIVRGLCRALFNLRIAVRVANRRHIPLHMSEQAVARLQEMFPNMPPETLRHDLALTGSMQITTERILTGQLVAPTASVSVASASAGLSQHGQQPVQPAAAQSASNEVGSQPMQPMQQMQQLQQMQQIHRIPTMNPAQVGAQGSHHEPMTDAHAHASTESDATRANADRQAVATVDSTASVLVPLRETGDSELRHRRIRPSDDSDATPAHDGGDQHLQDLSLEHERRRTILYQRARARYREQYPDDDCDSTD
eukprot:TRINITY_DN10568_c0_g1_i1.p1 TRINITY_DN10568_c0_g1~~TRINITY_DN10568_c0_g1_i1.p1  ORF type:complete len:655 (+),score=107.55 TRINITY_DN10568_c0_g1_i1:148-2112(+)